MHSDETLFQEFMNGLLFANRRIVVLPRCIYNKRVFCTWKTCLSVFVLSSVIVTVAAFNGESVTCYNTFQDARIIDTLTTVYDMANANIGNDVEFQQFPHFPLGKGEGGFYNIDMSYDDNTNTGTILFTLKNNSGAVHLDFTPGAYDRYYFFMENPVDEASVSGVSGSLVPTVYIPRYEELELVDVLQTGIVMPTLTDRVIVVAMSPGTDLANMGSSATITFKRNSPPPQGFLETFLRSWFEFFMTFI